MKRNSPEYKARALLRKAVKELRSFPFLVLQYAELCGRYVPEHLDYEGTKGTLIRAATAKPYCAKILLAAEVVQRVETGLRKGMGIERQT